MGQREERQPYNSRKVIAVPSPSPPALLGHAELHHVLPIGLACLSKVYSWVFSFHSRSSEKVLLSIRVTEHLES